MNISERLSHHDLSFSCCALWHPLTSLQVQTTAVAFRECVNTGLQIREPTSESV